MGQNNFRVIVVGGGPVGLTAAHVLQKAGIDFILLERRPHVVIDAGSNLVLNPQGMKALSQLGLQTALDAVSSPLGIINRVDHRGRNMGDMNWFLYMKKSYGVYPRVISRHDLTKVMYDALPTEAQAKVFSSKKLSDIKPTAEGVVATCVDGTSYEGSIIIGADGAHSIVRDLMWKLSHDAHTPLDTPFETTYRCLWIRFPKGAKLSPGTTCEAHGRMAATQLFVGEDTVVTGVYERLEQPTKERIRHTQADQDALVERWGHIPLTSDGELTLREAYDSRHESGLVSLEEGVVEKWSFDGRIVLAGDSAHKLTPSTGAGCNNGIIDIVALVNELRATLDNTHTTSSDANAIPSRTQLSDACEAYQQRRFAAIVGEVQGASNATAAATWQTRIHKMIDQHVISSKTVQKYLFGRGDNDEMASQKARINFLQGNTQVAAAA